MLLGSIPNLTLFHNHHDSTVYINSVQFHSVPYCRLYIIDMGAHFIAWMSQFFYTHWKSLDLLCYIFCSFLLSMIQFCRCLSLIWFNLGDNCNSNITWISCSFSSWLNKINFRACIQLPQTYTKSCTKVIY